MRKLFLLFQVSVFMAAVFCLSSCAGGGKSSATSWKSPTYQPASYRQVLVLARVDNEANRRLLEDAAAAELRSKGINAVTTYNSISGGDMASTERIASKAIDMGGDALLAFSGARVQNEYRQGPQVSASMGVPVNIGFGSIWLGGSVPIAGGPRKVAYANLDASFYTKATNGAQWSLKMSERLNRGAGDVARSIAETTVGRMQRDGIFR